MEHKEFVKIAIETSTQIDEAATVLITKAKEAAKNGEMDQDELVEFIVNYYDPLIVKAGLIIREAKKAVINDLNDGIVEIKNQTTVLKNELQRIESIEKIIETITMFISVGTAIVSAFAVPSSTTIGNALKATGKFIGHVSELNSDNEDL